MKQNHRYKESKQVTLIGALINTLLGTLKLIVGITGHSHALIADGFHSFSDLLTDGLVIYAAKFGSEEADVDHPYGHGRIETAATLALAMLLALVGAGIIYDALEHLFVETNTIAPHYFAVIVAAISVLANEGLYRYTLAIANKIDSNLLRANAWHSRSDAGSSIVVLIGIGGSLIGFPYLDAIAAVVVGLFVVKMGWTLGWSSLRELVDTGTDPKTLNQIKAVIHKVSGVQSIHQLRTRSMSSDLLVDVHVIVAPKLSVSEGHYIGHCVHHALMEQLPSVSDVTVHIDPEDDELLNVNYELPAREELIPELNKRFEGLPGGDAIKEIGLHYLGGKIQVQVMLSQGVKGKDVQTQYEAAIEGMESVERVEIWYS